MARRPPRRASSPVSVRREGDTRVEGLEALERRVAELPDVLRDQIKKAMVNNGKALVKRLRSVAPREKGDLLASIEMVEGPGPLAVTVRAGNAETPGKHVEYGHDAPDGTHVPAVPFFWPSYRVEKKAIRGRVVRATNAGVKAVTGGGKGR